jgi:hypothetical protein
MNSAERWNGHEPVVDVLKRHGLADAFYLALHDGDQKGAVRFLLAVGVDEAKARRLVSVAIKTPGAK